MKRIAAFCCFSACLIPTNCWSQVLVPSPTLSSAAIGAVPIPPAWDCAQTKENCSNLVSRFDDVYDQLRTAEYVQCGTDITSCACTAFSDLRQTVIGSAQRKIDGARSALKETSCSKVCDACFALQQEAGWLATTNQLEATSCNTVYGKQNDVDVDGYGPERMLLCRESSPQIPVQGACRREYAQTLAGEGKASRALVAALLLAVRNTLAEAVANDCRYNQTTGQYERPTAETK